MTPYTVREEAQQSTNIVAEILTNSLMAKIFHISTVHRVRNPANPTMLETQRCEKSNAKYKYEMQKVEFPWQRINWASAIKSDNPRNPALHGIRL